MGRPVEQLGNGEEGLGFPTLRRNATYTTAFTLVRLGLSLATVPVLTRSLGLARYGVWAVLFSLFSVTALLQLGIGPALSVQLAGALSERSQDTMAEVIGTSLLLLGGIGFAVAVLIASTAAPITTWLFRDASAATETRYALMFVALATWFQFLKQWMLATEAGFQRYDIQAWAEGTGAVLLNAGFLLLAMTGHGLVGLAAWLATATLACVVIHWVLLLRIGATMTSGINARASRVRSLLHIGVRQGVAQLGTNLFAQIDRVVVNVVLGPVAAGLYAAATGVVSRINEISAAPVQVIAPAMAEYNSRGAMQQARSLYRRAERLNMVIAFGLATLILVLAKPIAALIVPTERAAMEALLRTLAFAYGLYSANAVAFFAALGLSRPSLNAWWVSLAAAVFLPCLWFGAAHGLGLAGWANLAYAITLGTNYSVSHRLGWGPLRFVATYGGFAFALACALLISPYVGPLVLAHRYVIPIIAIILLAAVGYIRSTSRASTNAEKVAKSV